MGWIDVNNDKKASECVVVEPFFNLQRCQLWRSSDCCCNSKKTTTLGKQVACWSERPGVAALFVGVDGWRSVSVYAVIYWWCSQCAHKLWASRGLLSSVLHEAGGFVFVLTPHNLLSFAEDGGFCFTLRRRSLLLTLFWRIASLCALEQWEVQPLLFFCEQEMRILLNEMCYSFVARRDEHRRVMMRFYRESGGLSLARHNRAHC